jgi:hypothetical protein
VSFACFFRRFCFGECLCINILSHSCSFPFQLLNFLNNSLFNYCRLSIYLLAACCITLLSNLFPCYSSKQIIGARFASASVVKNCFSDCYVNILPKKVIQFEFEIRPSVKMIRAKKVFIWRTIVDARRRFGDDNELFEKSNKTWHLSLWLII